MQTAPELKHLRSINQIANAKTKKNCNERMKQKTLHGAKANKKKTHTENPSKEPKKKTKKPKDNTKHTNTQQSLPISAESSIARLLLRVFPGDRRCYYSQRELRQFDN